MRFAVVFALCACNRVFGVGAPIVERDAQQFDGLADAPFACPAMGRSLQFSTVIREAIPQNCDYYSISTTAGLATALCSDDANNLTISQGVPDQLLTPVVGIPINTPDFEVSVPRLSPEGDQLFVVETSIQTVVSEWAVYLRGADGSWTRGTDLPVAAFGLVSVPSRGPDRHLIYYENGPIIEWSDHGTGAWSPGATVDLGTAMPVRNIWLAPDGLRLIATVDSATPGLRTSLYADRATIEDAFNPTVPVTLPATTAPFVTEDCARVYVSSVHTVFYANQL